MEQTVAQARELHRRAMEVSAHADSFRAQRDELVRKLRAEDPRKWTLKRLAKSIGCSVTLIAEIVKRNR